MTAFVPSAWVDDSLIAERKQGLATYLNNLLTSTKYGEHSALTDFLSVSSGIGKEMSLEDALPSTLSRKAALEAQAKINASSLVAAAYYPDWSADSWPPESLDYSKFDVLFFGETILAHGAFLSAHDLGSVCNAQLVRRYQLG